MLISDFLVEKVKTCCILNHPINCSDHFALSMSVDLPLPQITETGGKFEMPRYDYKVKWSDPKYVDYYVENLRQELQNITLIDPDSVPGALASETANMLNTKLCQAMHNAAKACSSRNRHLRAKYWWTAECTQSRNRLKFWYHIWMECGKLSTGAVKDCYTLAKKSFRKLCRTLMTNKISQDYRIISDLYQHRDMNKLWNAIKRKSNKQEPINVSTEELMDYYKSKFSYTEPNNAEYNHACSAVNNKARNRHRGSRFTFSEALTVRYINRLKLNAAAGIDCITPGHLKYGLSTSLPLHISCLMTLCIRHSIVPQDFTIGVLIPIPKAGKDSYKPEGYRPIMVSTCMSKILEYYINDACGSYLHSPHAYGYVEARGTDLAISLAHDVCAHMNANGTPIYLCSLDAEGAFDFIPHNILFYKAINNVPDDCWYLIVKWYRSITAKLCINGQYHGEPLSIQRGTRQGGLTSPMLFNIFYRDLIDKLARNPRGINIRDKLFNVFNYADDVLIGSTTTSGLQDLIDSAVTQIRKDGLNFNPLKTECCVIGKSTLVDTPKWHIDGQDLQIKNTITYLGAELGGVGASSIHVSRRIKAAYANYYRLQSVGLHPDGLDPQTSAFLHQMTITPALLYGCQCIQLNKTDFQRLYTTQGNLIKSTLGLPHSSRTTPILKSLNIAAIHDQIRRHRLSLLARALRSNSAAGKFYRMFCSSQSGHTLLTDRVKSDNNISIKSLMFKSNNMSDATNDECGVTDSLVFLLSDFNHFNRDIAASLLKCY